jgi:hypothetical protein
MSRIRWRQIVKERLELLASEEEQIEYARSVPNVDVTAELLSGWFDDLYHPESEDFRLYFYEPEIEAMERFSEYCSRRKRELPPSNGGVQTWLQSPVWRDIMLEAQRALNVLSLKS